MTTLAAVYPVLPPHRYSQVELTAEFARVCLGEGSRQREVLARLHSNSRVEFRHLAIPIDRYRELADFTEANNIFIDVAVDLGAQAIRGALDRAGIRPDQVDLIISTTITGIAVPSLDARLAERVGFRPDIKRMPLFGLGCVAGAAGISRMHDYLLGHPDHIAVLLSVELCSLTIQRGDRSIPNLVASGLFGDGAAAVVGVGRERADRDQISGPQVIDTRSHLYPETTRTMGWDVGSTGLKIVLDAQVPSLVRQYVGDDVKSFAGDHGLDVSEIGCWVSHPGGPKVIQAIEEVLALPPDALEMTWLSLAAVGNLSSSSVLHVLNDTWQQRRPAAGTPSMLMAMGPGFCSELVLLRW